MQLDTINTLYLELSQVATATTAKEIALRKLLDGVDAVIWGDARPTNYEPDRALALTTILKLRDDHADKLAAQLAECAGYLASVRTDRKTRDEHGEIYAAQTMEWAEGAAEIAERVNATLEAHDDLRALQANTRRSDTP